MKLDTTPPSRAGHTFLPAGTIVSDIKGAAATVRSIEEVDGVLMACASMDNGAELLLPLSIIESGGRGHRVPLSFEELGLPSDSGENESRTIPVWEEQLQVETRKRETGKGVRIRKSVSENEETISVPLLHDDIRVEHVPIQKIISSGEMPAARQEGNTYIVPVFKEVLVVEKKICLEKEIRITRHQKTVESTQSISLKSETVSIENFDDGKKPAA